MAAICTDSAGTAAGAVCHTIAKLGYTTASIGAVGAACSADQNKGQECVPGEWRCVDGVWTGFTIAAIPIVSTHCGTNLKENHYSASCPADGGVCQAACDEGFPQKGGDGVFTCHNGRWTGYLLCLPPDCGPTIDKQPAESSAFAICAGDTTLGSECDAHCGDGFYATAGSGVATFTCEKEFGGAWLEQGHLFYESSLICARCPAIENCLVSSCATGTDAVCTECAAKYISFRLDEQPTRCLSEANTAATDGLTSDATGIIVFGIPRGTTLRAGGDGTINVGAAASLTVHGVADGTSVLDVDALDIEGAATISGVAMHNAELSVGAGASLTMAMATCGGATTLSISGAATITNGSLSFGAGVGAGLVVQQGGRITTTGTLLSFESAGVSVGGAATFTGGSLSFAAAGLSVQNCGGATFTGTSLSFAGVQTGLDVQSNGHVGITDTTISFAAGVGTGVTVADGATATATGATFHSTGDALPTAAPWTVQVSVSVEDGGVFTVAGSKLVAADGGASPMPCDGKGAVCAGEHAGAVEVAGPAAVRKGAPLVCDAETGACVGDVCAVVDCGAQGSCVSPLGTCACSQGYGGGRCETHMKCCSPCVSSCCGAGGSCDHGRGRASHRAPAAALPQRPCVRVCVLTAIGLGARVHGGRDARRRLRRYCA
jgi:hypothetical protein